MNVDRSQISDVNKMTKMGSLWWDAETGRGSTTVQYCWPRRYGTAELSTLVPVQSCIDAQPMKINILFYFHVNIETDMNQLIFFWSKTSEF